VIIGVPKETVAGERRVALVPSALKKIIASGITVQVEAGAGDASGISDGAYTEAGAKIGSAESALSADLVAKVATPTTSEIARLREGAVLVSVLLPFVNLKIVEALRARRISSFALDLMPRITRAQSMDVLSSMSTVAGYKAVLWAADRLPKFMPMLMTAAGTIKPARVLVLGAGVAGLQAIATARRLGAVVEAFDIRAAAKEQVESLGARFVELPQAEDAEGAGGYAKEQTEEQLAAQRAHLSSRMAEADAVICTALVPGRKAPVLMTADQVRGMRPGSVVVDLAAEQGGNCELTVAGQDVYENGVLILGPTHVASTMPTDASTMFARNVATFLSHLAPKGELVLNLEDEVTSGPLVTHEGAVTHEGVRKALEA
jgi:H+-translocating NAD(P) transhydrogenase subunit alpha